MALKGDSKMNSEVSTLTNDHTIVYKLKRVLYLSSKRIFDILISLIGLALLVPLALLVKLCYIITGDFHSIFFVQDRIGKNGKHFKFFKFRSMVYNADEVLFKMLEENPEMAAEYKKIKKLKNDPRITKMGKIIRKFSIDEMPQFINIFLGDMSLVGNRPYLPREKEDMGKYYDDIIKTKPGLTGYWQVSGRSNVTFLQRLKLEQEYSQKACFLLDCKIFFKTFKVVLFGKGAD